MATHSNAPLTLRAVVVSANALMLAAPLAHVADEGGVSRTALTKWYKRWLVHGHPVSLTAPHVQTTSPPAHPTTSRGWSSSCAPSRSGGPTALPDTSPRSVTVRSGSARPPCGASSADTDSRGCGTWTCPRGESKRDPRRYEHPNPGDMIHVDVKKVARIPEGGGWTIHGRGTDEARASRRVANRRPGASSFMLPWTTTAAWPTPKSTRMGVFVPARAASHDPGSSVVVSGRSS